jgi:hypothetical protein
MNARMVQYTQINKYNKTHKQNQGQKPHHLNRCRKSLQQNSSTFMIKALKKLGIKGTFLNN